MKLAIALLALLLMSGRSDGHQNVDRQEECDVKKHAYVVSVVGNFALKGLDAAAKYCCTGSLIELHWVVTSASCMYQALREKGFKGLVSNLSIIAGFDSSDNSYEERKVSKSVPFKQKDGMRSTADDDLVLLHLSEPFKRSPKVDVIELAQKGQTHRCKQAETVSPIPFKKKGGARGVSEFIALNVVCRGIKLVKNEVCKRSWFSWLTNAFGLCGVSTPSRRRRSLQLTDIDVCDQAEGSPLICNKKLIAVQSKCAKGGARAGQVQNSFLKVDPYLDFIANTVGDPSLKQKAPEKTTTTEEPASSGASFFEGALWKMAVGSVLLVCL